MGIKQDKVTGEYIVSYSKRHPKTRQPVSRRRIAKTKAEANRIYPELVLQVEQKLHEVLVPIWEVMVEDYRKASLVRGLSSKTVSDAHLCLKAHTVPEWGSRPMDSITTEEIRSLIHSKVGHRSKSHQKNLLKFIRSVFKYALELGVIKHNPTPDMKFKIGDKIKSVLTEKQIEILLNAAKEMNCEWYPHWTMALYTGMRNGELYALTWDKVNLDDRKIKVDCSWNNKDGFKSTKSEDDRIVAIAPSLATLLCELKLKNPDSSFVLPRIDKWDRGGQANELQMFLMGLGLPRIRFHDLRASWCTVMLSKGIEPIKVMYMGGWKDIKTMMIYMRKAGIEIQGITDCLELHNPSNEGGDVINFPSRSRL